MKRTKNTEQKKESFNIKELSKNYKKYSNVIHTSILVVCVLLLSMYVAYNEGYNTRSLEIKHEYVINEYMVYAQETDFNTALEDFGIVIMRSLLDNMHMLFLCFVILVWGVSSWRLIEVSR